MVNDITKMKVLYDQTTDAVAAIEKAWKMAEQSDNNDIEVLFEASEYHMFKFRCGEFINCELTVRQDNSNPEVKHVFDTPHIELEAEHDIFDKFFNYDDTELAQAVQELIAPVKLLYQANPDTFQIGYGLSYPHEGFLLEDALPLPVTEASISEHRINYLPWMTLFPPVMVDTYGASTLLSAPAYHTEALDDGAIVLVTHQNPLASHDTAAIDDHLDIDRPPSVEEHDF